jgi:hypothetical protein
MAAADEGVHREQEAHLLARHRAASEMAPPDSQRGQPLHRSQRGPLEWASRIEEEGV